MAPASNPVGQGVANFLDAFSQEAEKGADAKRNAEGKEQFEQWKTDYMREHDKHEEDKKKTPPGVNPKAPHPLTGTHADPKLMAARKYLTAVSKNEKDFDSFHQGGYMNSPLMELQIANEMKNGKDQDTAIKDVWTKNNPDKYQALSDAHHGHIAHILQQYPILAEEYPNYASYAPKAGTPVTPEMSQETAPPVQKQQVQAPQAGASLPGGPKVPVQAPAEGNDLTLPGGPPMTAGAAPNTTPPEQDSTGLVMPPAPGQGQSGGMNANQ